ncbi:uncharacterized protein K452DRAFT_314550 [Aplosporella prunicola CBS 121167]|uniref:Protein transport protein BOS1 n=1 Tax=Aplosporella prunicola CBS 121167 TaxID=1176127 RepID=A0A6A6BVK5_9PEZI|nr:uncharacterized protein K452DRAFT_314550 [Aplosporella prunicola CBS 121167]KAF2147373.1 hypothetical protein K452DRAFT_314550 [Aplosporella prunicola CBS 121167]
MVRCSYPTARSSNPNSLFNSARRQSTALRKELDGLAQSSSSSSSNSSNGSPLPPALLGQTNASLASFGRTIEDYARLARHEPGAAEQETAYERIDAFTRELAEYRERFARLKQERDDERQAVPTHAWLFGRRHHHTDTPENPYAATSAAQYSPWWPYCSANSSALDAGSGDYTREERTFRHQSFTASINVQLDEFLGRGSAVLRDLEDQREMLNGTRRKLYSVANMLEVSNDTIRMVKRCAKQDKWMFWGGVTAFSVFCYLVLKWLR